jgi:hypothetical protein
LPSERIPPAEERLEHDPAESTRAAREREIEGWRERSRNEEANLAEARSRGLRASSILQLLPELAYLRDEVRAEMVTA